MALKTIEDLEVLHNMCEDREGTEEDQGGQWMEEDDDNEGQVRVDKFGPQAAEQRLSSSSFIYAIIMGYKRDTMLKD